MGKLEDIAVQLAGITGKVKNQVERRRIIVLCADNGVTEEGVSLAPKSVTVAQAINMGRAIWGTQNVFTNTYAVDIEDSRITERKLEILEEAAAVLEAVLHLKPHSLKMKDLTPAFWMQWTDTQLIDMARTDARTVLGIEEAIERGIAYKEAGADIVFIESPETKEEMQLINDKVNCLTLANMYCGGTGGSARGGVCKHPVAITEAVHDGRAQLTIGGAPAFVYPGGGINFIVDTAKVINKAFTWVPTPATVAPVEYTMAIPISM